MSQIYKTFECTNCGIVIEAEIIAADNPIFSGPDASDPDEVVAADVYRYDNDGHELSVTSYTYPDSYEIDCRCGEITLEKIINQ